MPKVSIIIPVFNREKLISETLNSISSQSFEDWECILVDDHSTDSSLEILRKYELIDSRFKVFIRPDFKIKGAASCRNFGFQQTKGKMIQYFDSDDLMEKSMLEKKVALLETDDELDFIVSKMGHFYKEGEFLESDYKNVSENFQNDFLTYKICFLTPGPIFRKDFLNRFSVLFDESLSRRQEREFYSRIILSRPKFEVFNEVHCYRRMHPESIQSQYDPKATNFHLRSKFEFYNALTHNSSGKFKKEIFEACGPELIMLLKKSMKAGLVYLTFSYALLLFKWKF